MPGEHFIHRAVLPTWLAVAACVLLLTGRTLAQSPDEHASHHPGAAPAAGAMSGGAPAGGMSATAGAPGMAGMGATAGAGPSAGAGGMMEGMGEMMKNMGKPPPKEFVQHFWHPRYSCSQPGSQHHCPSTTNLNS